MSRPLLSDLPLWERHEQRVLSILRSALVRLRSKEPKGDELKLNRALYFCILEVNNENRQSGDSWLDYPPLLEGRNPPTPETEGLATERKIPDLQWSYIDHQASDPRCGVRTFAIECKRLGSRSGAGAILSLRYVDDGVRRFVDLEWQYGKDVATGAMVGYVESLTSIGLVMEVNKRLNHLCLPSLTLRQESEDRLTEMEHFLDRSFELTPFRLVHLWIDISPAH